MRERSCKEIYYNRSTLVGFVFVLAVVVLSEYQNNTNVLPVQYVRLH